jgi:hypothetical protein
MKRFLLTLALTIVTCISTSYAYASPPTRCPSVDAIKAAPFYMLYDYTEQDGKKFYRALQEDQKYDTNWPGDWHTQVYHIEASSIEDAHQKLNLALPNLTLKKGPYKNSNGGWDCAYSMSNEIEVYTYTELA